MRLWDAETGAERRQLCGHELDVNDVAFSPDGRRVFSNSWDKTVRVWHASNGECLEVRNNAGKYKLQYPNESAWRMLKDGMEAVITKSSDARIVARFPGSSLMKLISPHPSGSMWAAVVGNHLQILALEGVGEPT